MCFAGGMEKIGQRDTSLRRDRRVQVIPAAFTLLKRQLITISSLFTMFIHKEISRIQLTTFNTL